MKYLLSVVFFFNLTSGFAQITIGSTSNNSILDLNSIDSGMLVPRMLESDKLSITNLEQGLLIYQLNVSPGFKYYNASWNSINSGVINASDVKYDITSSSFSTDNLQSILEEVSGNLVFTNLNTSGYGVKDLGLNSPSFSEVSIGQYNSNYAQNSDTTLNPNDRIFSIGIGDSSTNKNVLEIFKNGKIYANDLDLSEISNDKHLVTKEYIGNVISTPSSHPRYNVGDSYLGGIVYFTWDNGRHGLIVADVQYSGEWDKTPYKTTNCRFNGIGAGKINTEMMYEAGVNLISSNFLNQQQVYSTSVDLDADSVNDNIGGWYVPNQQELKELLIASRDNYTLINNPLNNKVGHGRYWTSREASNSSQAVAYEFTNLSPNIYYREYQKNNSIKVRLIKDF